MGGLGSVAGLQIDGERVDLTEVIYRQQEGILGSAREITQLGGGKDLGKSEGDKKEQCGQSQRPNHGIKGESFESICHLGGTLTSSENHFGTSKHGTFQPGLQCGFVVTCAGCLSVIVHLDINISRLASSFLPPPTQLHPGQRNPATRPAADILFSTH